MMRMNSTYQAPITSLIKRGPKTQNQQNQKLNQPLSQPYIF